MSRSKRRRRTGCTKHQGRDGDPHAEGSRGTQAHGFRPALPRSACALTAQTAGARAHTHAMQVRARTRRPTHTYTHAHSFTHKLVLPVRDVHGLSTITHIQETVSQGVRDPTTQPGRGHFSPAWLSLEAHLPSARSWRWRRQGGHISTNRCSRLEPVGTKGPEAPESGQRAGEREHLYLRPQSPSGRRIVKIG